jgi:hypothetical protein
VTPPRRLLLLAALAASLVAVAPAAAAPACGGAVIEDWSDGRIDKQYPLHCYDEAVEMLPPDVRDYSSAEADMRRALQAAKRGNPAPPNRDRVEGPAEPPSPPPAPPTATTPETPTTTDTETTGTPPPTPPEGPPTEVIEPVDVESASSIPIPLLILAGLALLLLVGGSAGYVLRRLQARRIPPSAA